MSMDAPQGSEPGYSALRMGQVSDELGRLKAQNAELLEALKVANFMLNPPPPDADLATYRRWAMYCGNHGRQIIRDAIAKATGGIPL